MLGLKLGQSRNNPTLNQLGHPTWLYTLHPARAAHAVGTGEFDSPRTLGKLLGRGGAGVGEGARGLAVEHREGVDFVKEAVQQLRVARLGEAT